MVAERHKKFINLPSDKPADLHQGWMGAGGVDMTLGFWKAAEGTERESQSRMLRRSFGEIVRVGHPIE